MQLRAGNRYFALRHGISVANEQGCIVSHPENGIDRCGLSTNGAAECRRLLSPDRLRAHDIAPINTVVYTSDFRRAAETAAIFCELNQLPAAIPDTRLRERNFGRFEGQAIAAYDLVWARDALDEHNDMEGCETIATLAARLRSLLEMLEARHQNETVVLVSHGDPLQVLQTILLGRRPNQHRSLPHLGNAELRRIA